MAKRYRRTFEFFNTEEQAEEFCTTRNKNSSYYVRLKHKAYYTPWTSRDKTEHKFIAWYVV